jgi:hypothetical protein
VKQYLVRGSYLEIYNEEIKDLMSKKPSKLELRDKDTGVYVKDLSTFVEKLQLTCLRFTKRNFTKTCRRY